jgi:hypothetical protein
MIINMFVDDKVKDIEKVNRLLSKEVEGSALLAALSKDAPERLALRAYVNLIDKAGQDLRRKLEGIKAKKLKPIQK